MEAISWRWEDTPLFLAPMAGITDWAFRLLCQEQGCDAATTEMISAQGFLTAKKQKNAYFELYRQNAPRQALAPSDATTMNGIQIRPA